MSKNKKRYRKQKSSFPWLLVVLGGGLLLIAAFFFTRQASDGGGTPSIQVDQQNIDYGYVNFGQTRSFAVKVTNTGDGTLRFKDKPFVEVLKGC